MSSKDAPVLADLRKAGSKLDLPHPIRHYLYVPTQSSAEAAARILRGERFDAQVQRAALGDQWLVLTTHMMVPTEEAIACMRARFEKLAAEQAGEYDGWEAGIVRG